MQFFFFCRDKAGAGQKRQSLIKDHWAFMRRYESTLIARGPTLSADGKTMTGSMHIADLPDAHAAQVFAYEDPFAQGGVFENIMVRRYQNVLGRTMWQFRGDPGNPRFLFVGEVNPGSARQGGDLLDAQRAYLGGAERTANVILFGPLLGTDGATWEGTAMLLEAPDAAGAQALVQGDPATAAQLYARTELLPWRFGGEVNLQDLAARRT